MNVPKNEESNLSEYVDNLRNELRNHVIKDIVDRIGEEQGNLHIFQSRMILRKAKIVLGLVDKYHELMKAVIDIKKQCVNDVDIVYFS